MQKIYYVNTYERTNLYELWQQHKQLNSMGMNKAWLDIYIEVYIHLFQTGPTYTIQ